MFDTEKVIRPVFPANSPRITIQDEYKYYSKAIESYENKAIQSFLIENYFYEENELLIWWFIIASKSTNNILSCFSFSIWFFRIDLFPKNSF
jgi:hypothetical protein